MIRASVIVPAFDASAHLGRCLEALMACSGGCHEVIVVDDGSSDGTSEIARSFACDRLTVVKLRERKGPALARNIGAALSRAEALFFTDSDCEVSSDWIEQGLRSLEAAEAVEGYVFYACAAPTLAHKLPLNPFYNLRQTGALTVPRRDFGASNLAVRREVFGRLRGFDHANFPEGREDTDLGYRISARGQVASNPQMRVTHREEVWSWPALSKNSRRYRADVVFLARHGSFPFRWGPILHPRLLLLLIFPPLILWYCPPRSLSELRFVPIMLAYLARARLTIWRAAIAERVVAL